MMRTRRTSHQWEADGGHDGVHSYGIGTQTPTGGSAGDGCLLGGGRELIAHDGVRLHAVDEDWHGQQTSGL